MYKVIIFAALCAYAAGQTIAPMSAFGRLVAQMNMCDNRFLCRLNTTTTTCDVECIDTVRVCDGKKDCTNGVDELNCAPRCPSGVICRNDRRTCATPCDGTVQCTTGMEDEMGCPTRCPAGQLLCNDRTTCTTPCNTAMACPTRENIWNCATATCTAQQILCNDLMTCAGKCDGNRECPTAEDEACPFQCQCRPGNYLCMGNDRICLPRSSVCNEVTNECPMNDDETPC